MPAHRKVTYDVLKDPRDEVYRGLLDHATTACSGGSLITRDPTALRDRARALLQELAPSITREETVTKWPGTELFLGYTARASWFRFDADVVRTLLKYSSHLYQWVEPDLPEDLCLYRNDDSVWLATIAHEHDAYFELSRLEHAALRRAVPALIIRPH